MISLLHIYCVYIDTQRYIYFRRVLFNLGYVNGVRGIRANFMYVRNHLQGQGHVQFLHSQRL